MRKTTRRDYEERLRLVIAKIAQGLDAPADLGALAEAAGFSLYHFHRIFGAMTGESVAAFQRRLRLERAASRLSAEGWPVGVVALEAGFDSPESFCRAFRAAYGVPPSRFAAEAGGRWHPLPAPNGAHWPDPRRAGACANRKENPCKSRFATSRASAWQPFATSALTTGSERPSTACSRGPRARAFR